MELRILAVYKNLDDYVTSLKKDPYNAEMLWEKYAIEPYWNILCQYAQEDLSYRKPKPITNIPTLEKQLNLLKQIDLIQLKDEFERIVSALPNYDDDPIYIALYPASDDDITVKERQNGVVGASTYGNMFIRLNPLAEDYLEWIPYVFAHEYHHSVLGNYWFVIHSGNLEDKFINSLLIDGEADSFALSLYPELKPKWLFELSEDKEKSLWKDLYSNIILEPEQNVDYGKYMFGDESCGIPWCAGYAIGYRIVQQYLKSYSTTTFSQLLEMHPLDIYQKSGYNPLTK